MRPLPRWGLGLRRRLGKAPGVGPAVDDDRGAGDECSTRAGQKGDRLADLLGLSETAKWDRAPGLLQRVRTVGGQAFGLDRPAADADRAHPEPAPLERE